MKILFLTPQFPYPLDNGGKIGAYNGIDVLAGNDVTVLSFTEDVECIEEGCEYLSEKFPDLNIQPPIIHDVHIKKKFAKLGFTLIKSYFSKYPYLCEKFRSNKMFSLIDKLMIDNKYDIIFIDYLNMQIYGDYISDKYADKYNKMILKDHNIEHEIVEQLTQSSSFIKKALLKLVYKKTKAFEIESLKKADLVFSVCDENTDYFSQFNKQSYSMKPTFEILPYRKGLTEMHKVLYIGNVSWEPNMDGLKWFVENVWSIISDLDKNATLDVVGSGNVQNPFNGKENINWLGYIKDLSSIYEQYRVFVVPLFEGSGIRIKILEAFNNDIPVVATSMSCKTIGAKIGNDILVADEAYQFAGYVVELLNDNEKCAMLKKNAKDFMTNNYSIEKRRIEVKQIMSKVLMNYGNNDK